MCDVWEKTVAHKKEKAATQATWTISNDRNGTSKLPEERRRNVSPTKLTSMRPSEDW